MYNVDSDKTTGKLKIFQSWDISEAPLFENIGDEYSFSYINIENVETLKSLKINYTNGNPNRYLGSYYRISRDGKSWTEWFQ